MSLSGWNNRRRRAYSSRERNSRPLIELHRENLDRIQRRFDKELAKSERELRWAHENLHESNIATKRYISNLQDKLKDDYNQLVEEKIYEIEKYLSDAYEEERQLVEEKYQDIQMESEKLYREKLNQAIRERDTIFEDKLALQRSFYNQLLNEQERRLRAERSLQTFDSLNISQLKDRLTRVEQSNHLLRRSVNDLIDQQQPLYKTTVYIPKFGV